MVTMSHWKYAQQTVLLQAMIALIEVRVILGTNGPLTQ